MSSKRVYVTDMSKDEARKFFLEESSYLPVKMPKYFNFQSILNQAENIVGNNDINSMSNNLSSYDDLNYSIVLNKDGRYDWRKVQIVNPLLYVNLVNDICSNWDEIIYRFKYFQSAYHIKCISIPVKSKSAKSNSAENILNWWENLEQKSISYALEYKYCAKTDITNCYGSIYTHSIPWALHGFQKVKDNLHKKKSEKLKLYGDKIDKDIRDMQHGQTNGIPQGGALFDFIAEIVLGYVDKKLSDKLAQNVVNQGIINDYKILRYRDDYRIFSNSKENIEKILKILSETMSEFNMHFNVKKTSVSDDIINASIKEDKKYWSRISSSIVFKNEYNMTLQKHLIQIYFLAKKFPNSGSVTTALKDFNIRLKQEKEYTIQNSISQIIAIISNIIVMSPKNIQMEVATLGILLKPSESSYESPKKINTKKIINKIMDKLYDVPNLNYTSIWIQRILLPMYDENNNRFSDPLCQKVYGSNKENIWNNNWLTSNKKINEIKLVDKKQINKLKLPLDRIETDVFYNYNL